MLLTQRMHPARRATRASSGNTIKRSLKQWRQRSLRRRYTTMEPQHSMFKFTKEYMKFVAFILMFQRATREGNWKLNLNSSPMIDFTMNEWYRCTWHKRNFSNQLIPKYMKNSRVEICESTRMTHRFAP